MMSLFQAVVRGGWYITNPNTLVTYSFLLTSNVLSMTLQNGRCANLVRIAVICVAGSSSTALRSLSGQCLSIWAAQPREDHWLCVQCAFLLLVCRNLTSGRTKHCAVKGSYAFTLCSASFKQVSATRTQRIQNLCDCRIAVSYTVHNELYHRFFGPLNNMFVACQRRIQTV